MKLSTLEMMQWTAIVFMCIGSAVGLMVLGYLWYRSVTRNRIVRWHFNWLLDSYERQRAWARRRARLVETLQDPLGPYSLLNRIPGSVLILFVPRLIGVTFIVAGAFLRGWAEGSAFESW